MKLVIIEGAGKQATIEKYLGSGYKVFATKGHIRDLPLKRIGVDIKKNFAPKYEIMPDKQDVVNKLQSAAKKADQIYLATDPDREGEAISWHLASILDIGLDAPVRIVFNEISKKAINTALDNPRSVDINLVDAQQARRVLDRLVGYKLSPLLIKKIQRGMSAGRVQSVTLRLIVDREREIRAFVPEEYWTFFSVLQVLDAKGSQSKFKAELHSIGGKKIKLGNKEELDVVRQAIAAHKYTVTNVKKSVTTSKSPAPFVTSTMQQDALNKLGMSLKQTSLSAQALYEGVELGTTGKTALVTYIRTDSPRVSPDAQAAAKEYIIAKYGDRYCPAKPNIFKSKKAAQDAHECIRPIDIKLTPDSVKQHLRPADFKLYKLIYERFLASQMSMAQYNSVSVDIDCNNYNFRATGRSVLFEGYTVVYSNYSEKKEEPEDNALLPDLQVGDKPDWIEDKFEQKFTKPPARYNEASLVKKMEESGIGRPATYTPTIATIIARKYVTKDGKTLVPTELGFKCVDMLVNYFPDIMNVEFTADMEQNLDDIEDGGKNWQSVIGTFYGEFEPKLKQALGDSYTLKEPDEETDWDCSQCGHKLVIKDGRYGKFFSCSNYPTCKHMMVIGQDGQPIDKPKPVVSDVKCDKCGADMLERQGKYGKFLGCSAYPKCRNLVKLVTEDDTQSLQDVLPNKCPKCDKPLKKITYGKAKQPFYGCTGYPECKYTTKTLPE
ncbi:MAG: type I DNA topoisomerase [Clostridiales bacterium]|jgi:DNA topoisomerase-1|nr:type I DNA topoisomerase [Clostridiales bacterium]